MQIGITLPAHIRGVSGGLILEWARKADLGPFSTLSVIDRLVYPNYEPLVSLAAAAGVTQRIRLLTGVLLAPLRDASLLAKQAASLDAISGGRLTLGLGVGAREDDFRAVRAPFTDRGRRFEQQLEIMKRVWSGQPLADDVGPIGPPPARPGGPELLIGGQAPAAIQRVARWADGYIVGGGDAAAARERYALAEEAWKAAARSGRPRFVASLPCALGPNAAERAGANVRDYYAFLGPLADRVAGAVATSPEAIKDGIRAFEDAGVDELVLGAAIPDLDQVDRLADLVG
ncbi:MAG TPA: LLM class flavin-dependent oxidoreductase [Chloroflexota bacterium]|nr:LLM class flavin-dependent oxidoreductase [Chloroflexota bacterium]